MLSHFSGTSTSWQFNLVSGGVGPRDGQNFSVSQLKFETLAVEIFEAPCDVVLPRGADLSRPANSHAMHTSGDLLQPVWLDTRPQMHTARFAPVLDRRQEFIVALAASTTGRPGFQRRSCGLHVRKIFAELSRVLRFSCIICS